MLSQDRPARDASRRPDPRPDAEAGWLYGSSSWLACVLRRILARLRWNLALVCQMDADRDPATYHDYPDSAEAEPMHFYTYTCTRCGKRFGI